MLTKPVYNLSSYSLRGDGLGLRPFLFLMSNAITLAWLPSDMGSCTMKSNVCNTVTVKCILQHMANLKTTSFSYSLT